MKNPFAFLQEARTEVRKVVWPTRNETMVSTIMVLIMATLITIVFSLVDLVVRYGLSGIIDLFS